MIDDDRCMGVGSQDHLWVLCDDRRGLRLQLPLLPIGGRAKPIKVSVEFDTGAIDQMLQRLSELRTQMLPPPERN